MVTAQLLHEFGFEDGFGSGAHNVVRISTSLFPG